MSKFFREALGAALNILGSSSENTEDSENIYQQIAKCKAEIAELKGTGTTTVINFSKESGKALFGLASSSDESNKIPEENLQKIADLEKELEILSCTKKESQAKKGKSSDSPDGLNKDEFNGNLVEYFEYLNENGIDHEIVHQSESMIAIKTFRPWNEQNSMPSMLKNMMEKMVSKLPGSSEESSVDKNSDITLDDGVKSQAEGVVADLANVVLDFVDVPTDSFSVANDRSWYTDTQVMESVKSNEENNAALFAPTPIDDNEAAKELMKLQVSWAIEEARNGKTALMPININGNHWVGGAMTQEGEKFKFIHNDPLGKPINEDLKEALESQKVEVIDLQHEQQKDSYNCGPFTADNLSKFAEAIKNKKDGSSVSDENFQANLKEKLSVNGDQLRQEQQSEIKIGNLKSPTTPQASSREGQERVWQK